MDEQHVVTVTRTGCSCSCGEFSKVTVSGGEGARLAHRHAGASGGRVVDLRMDDPAGELKAKKAKKKQVRTPWVVQNGYRAIN